MTTVPEVLLDTLYEAAVHSLDLSLHYTSAARIAAEYYEPRIAELKQRLERESAPPTEAMCDKARWFILARDANIHTWGGLSRCVYGRTIPYIEDKIKNDPLGHITKWDVAHCIYELMTTEIEGDVLAKHAGRDGE